jgi:putative ABC transport system ATP-binding protein
MPRLSIDDLTITYGSGDLAVTPIRSFTRHIDEGSLALLLGPSGCGKTTLLSCLAGILTPTSGRITFGDIDITGLAGSALTEFRRHQVGIVFQGFNLVVSLDATENVMIPMRAAGVSRAEARRRALELLDRVGLAERAHHHPGDLSGGQQQRVAIARSLALDPPLIIADEPTANLDHVQVEMVLRTLRSLTERGRTVVVSTHDHRLLALADEVVELAPMGAPVVARGTERRALQPGDVLFAEGSEGHHVYEVVSGEVQISTTRPDGTSRVLARIGAGDCFGEMAPLFGLPRTATATATTAAELVGYTVADFREHFGSERLMALVTRTESQNDAARGTRAAG